MREREIGPNLFDRLTQRRLSRRSLLKGAVLGGAGLAAAAVFGCESQQSSGEDTVRSFMGKVSRGDLPAASKMTVFSEEELVECTRKLRSKRELRLEKIILFNKVPPSAADLRNGYGDSLVFHTDFSYIGSRGRAESYGPVVFTLRSERNGMRLTTVDGCRID